MQIAKKWYYITCVFEEKIERIAAWGMETGALLTDDATIYDLTGRRAEIASKGIYTINGKKVLVK